MIADVEPESIGAEVGIHGPRWETFHNGYFGDSRLAAPLVEAVRRVMEAQSPTVVADLGGGTGAVLHQVLAADPGASARFVDVDVSEPQLAACADSRIEKLPLPLQRMTRDELGVGSGGLIVIMRSVLHYFGRKGMLGLLLHVRSLMKPGEAFVHQSACFASARDADCLNALYSRMGTDKSYPTISLLTTALGAAGFAINGVGPAPSLMLECRDLAARYRLSVEDLAGIGVRLADEYGTIPDVFVPGDGGFRAYLHYRIFTCTAV